MEPAAPDLGSGRFAAPAQLDDPAVLPITIGSAANQADQGGHQRNGNQNRIPQAVDQQLQLQDNGLAQ
jgi:hypothetical protein